MTWSRAPAAAGRRCRADAGAGASRAGRRGPQRRRPHRAGADPAGDHRPANRRPAAVRRRRPRWSPTARSTTTASCRPACRSPPAAIASRRCICGGSRGTGLCRAAARHVRHRHPRPRHPQPDADARPLRHQAAVHRDDPGRAGLRLRAAGAARRRAGRPRRCARPRATSCCRCSSPPAPTRSSPASSACCPARRCAWWTATWSTASGWRRCRPARRRTSARRRRWPGWTRRSSGRWTCTSAATCRTACSCPAAWTAPRCWR